MIRYICVQPVSTYYAWQLEVMLTNFLEMGIEKQYIHILIGYDDHSSEQDIYNMTKVGKKFDINFHFYPDTRTSKYYISSLRPNILKQHSKLHPGVFENHIFYHDCDILFTKKPDLELMDHGNAWYASDTNSYINYDYIISKGQDVYKILYQIIGIDPLIPKLLNSQSGGAQYIMRNANYEYWGKVEKDCEHLYRDLGLIEEIKVKKDPAYHPLQRWTSDMWAVLWNAWYFGHEVKVDKRLDFSWATDSIEKWDQNSIYHNAGVVDGKGDLFYKGDYINKLPYDTNLNISPKNCSYNYYQQVLKVGKDSCLK
jgi:hypothetical protein